VWIIWANFYNFRTMLSSRLLLTALAVLCQCAAFADPVIKTSHGYIRGVQEKEVHVFKGIPYARAARFKAPVQGRNWSDTLSCTAFGPVAPQAGDGSEDCLSLNLYAPASGRKMPVVVWVHGGGMTGGSGKGMNGHAFADHDSIITITINYRLGALGFLYMGDVPGYETAPNNGLLDLIMALRWIQENISAFGGDPAQVTVMGESAGAKLTSVLLVTPAAKGKYKQLILESGSVNCIRDLATVKAIRRRLMDTLGISDPRALLTMPVGEIMNAQAKVLGGAKGTNYFGPMADNKIVMGDAYNWLKKHPSKGVKVLLGSNKAEALLFMNMDRRLVHPDVHVLRDWFGKNGDLVAIPQDSATAVVTLSAIMYRLHTYRLANVLPNAWLYSYEKGLATHGEELALIWGEQSSELHKDWVNFIKGRSPWTRYDSRKLGMIYDDHSREEPIPGYEDLNYPAMGFLLD
jgi:para-nitrobenzyl esterase